MLSAPLLRQFRFLRTAGFFRLLAVIETCSITDCGVCSFCFGLPVPCCKFCMSLKAAVAERSNF